MGQESLGLHGGGPGSLEAPGRRGNSPSVTPGPPGMAL